MSISDNAIVRLEIAAQPQGSAAALTNSGDNQRFEFGFAPLSKLTGFQAVVMTAGVASGLVITPTANDDEVAVSSGEAVLPSGASANADTGIVAVAATAAVAVTRPGVNNVVIVSIVANNDGTVLAVQGTDGSGFTDTRNVAGGPPYIPATSVEVGQLRLTSDVAAPVLASEIVQVPGLSQEISTQPSAVIDYLNGAVNYSAPLPLIHTGGTPREVFGKGSTPQYIEMRATDFVPAERTYSQNSTQIYGEVIGAASQALGSASWTAYLQDGITDAVLSMEGQEVWSVFHQDRNLAPNIKTLGRLGVSRSFPAGDNLTAALTQLAASPSTNHAA